VNDLGNGHDRDAEAGRSGSQNRIQGHIHKLLNAPNDHEDIAALLEYPRYLLWKANMVRQASNDANKYASVTHGQSAITLKNLQCALGAKAGLVNMICSVFPHLGVGGHMSLGDLIEQFFSALKQHVSPRPVTMKSVIEAISFLMARKQEVYRSAVLRFFMPKPADHKRVASKRPKTNNFSNVMIGPTNQPRSAGGEDLAKSMMMLNKTQPRL